ncbi:MAG: hypothetical protein JEZ02_13180, partial [Desulfatibacillum sp.]|nr:hypothetical protein [Desulfatibacillum sp.]
MYLLCLDDSGSVDDPTQEYFVLGGICVPENTVFWITSQLDKLAREIEPDNPGLVEFHASEIFSGRREPWSNFRAKEQRIRIILKVLDVLKETYKDTTAFA